ncbi:MAG: TetR/AcrR family transcriptional regulator [Nitrospirae bacterium]|nr:MAG: TetR/AcrR family transcriptional regulator [Nitrospirota bacterium]
MARPKEFDPDQALDRATEVFWRRGYEATSIEDLTTAMGINRGSLYDTFGGKQKLFLACMDRYCHGTVASRLSMLNHPGSALETIRTFIQMMLELGLSYPERKGCLIANTVMELGPREQEIGNRTAKAMGDLEETFFKTLTRAKAQGELRSGKDPRSLARFLTTMMQGVIVMLKAGTPADALRDTVRTGLSVLD